MGQILNRLIKIAKSYTVSDSMDHANRIINSDDEELKRIIEELNNYKKETHQSQENKQDSKSENKQSQSANMNLEKACKILGLQNNPSIEEIKDAYKKKVKEYHPDKVETLGDELKELARRKTQEINLAYEFLRKAKGF